MFSLTKAAVAEIDDLPVLKESICDHLHILQQRLSLTFLISMFLTMIG